MSEPVNKSAEENANWFLLLTYEWITPLLRAGYKSPLSIESLTPLSTKLQANEISARFESAWSQELKDHPSRTSLYRALHNSFGDEFIWAGIFRLIGDQILVWMPVLMLYLIEYINASETAFLKGVNGPPSYIGYCLVVSIFVAQILQVLFVNKSYEWSMRVGYYYRTALTVAIFRKSLRLSTASRQIYNSGMIMNIVSTDVNRFDMSSQFIHLIWSAPLQIVVAIAILCWKLNVAAGFCGLGMIIVTIPFQIWATKRMSLARKSASAASDIRIKLTQEAIQGIRVIKLYAWEKSFMETLRSIRKSELILVRWILMLRSIVIGILQTMPILACIVTTIVYVLVGNTLTSAIAYTALALFYVMRIPLLVYPQVLSQFADSKIAIDRIHKFLVAAELDSLPTRLEYKDSDEYAIVVDNLSCCWETQKNADEQTKLKNVDEPIVPLSTDKSSMFTGLHQIGFRVKKGELVAVVGPVGAGKSSLFSALIGDMKKSEGNVTFYGSVAFCSQNAWIQNMSLRDNILFGASLDEEKYLNTLHACALESDIAILPGGDLTEIGEKGVNISGGQKQRINLARAVYSDSDIIFMDDPLSAVDAHVGAHIFEECILGELSKKTRLLASHRLNILPQCDRVILLDSGKVVAQGTYDELMKTSVHFVELMESLTAEEKQKASPSKEKTQKSKLSGKKTLQAMSSTGQTKIVSEEERSTGHVKWSYYQKYFNLAGGAFFTSLVIVTLIVSQVTRVVNDSWLSVWANNAISGWPQSYFMAVYIGLGVWQTIIMVFGGIFFAYGGQKASLRIYDKALMQVFKAPISWFDSQPLGRIINRFSRDTDTVDSYLPDTLRVFLFTFAMTVAVFIVVAVVLPLFLAPLFPILVLYWFTQHFFRRSSVEIKRLDNISRSPLFAHFSESLTNAGQLTIRAFNKQDYFCQTNQKLLDANGKAYYLSIICQRWISTRIEFLASILIFFACLLGIVFRSGADVGLVALCITYSMQVSSVLTWCVKQATEAETYMNSVERLIHYTSNIPNEVNGDSLGSDSEKQLPPETNQHIAMEQVVIIHPEWPQRGQIQFEDVYLRFRDDLPDVLKGVTFEIGDGQKLGLVGRTGAGKSSIIQALFMLVRPRKGKIVIDGVDCSTIPLSDLRSKLAIIPQDPFIFSGTLRKNLDPFNEYTDDQLWRSIELCGLNNVVDAVTQLEMPVSEGGENWSTGQRQLICLARAMLRNSKILILDEATASVDMKTDSLIQKSLRENFSKCTVITIAHRLNTIMDYDKIIVLGQGKVLEEGSPSALMEKNGIFYEMVSEQKMASSN